MQLNQNKIILNKIFIINPHNITERIFFNLLVSRHKHAKKKPLSYFF